MDRPRKIESGDNRQVIERHVFAPTPVDFEGNQAGAMTVGRVGHRLTRTTPIAAAIFDVPALDLPVFAGHFRLPCLVYRSFWAGIRADFRVVSVISLPAERPPQQLIPVASFECDLFHTSVKRDRDVTVHPSCAGGAALRSQPITGFTSSGRPLSLPPVLRLQLGLPFVGADGLARFVGLHQLSLPCERDRAISNGHSTARATPPVTGGGSPSA